MKRITAALAIALTLAACSGEERGEPEPRVTVTVTEQARESTQSTRSISNDDKPSFYGSDPEMDRLYDKCEAGDKEACLELFWESDLDSGYEEYAMSKTTGSERIEYRGIDADAADETPNDRIAFMMAWDNQDSSTQEQLCWYFETYPDDAYEDFISGDGVYLARARFNEFFSEVC